ncbi:MAG TPA: neutral zinc metallopeptidase [Candidatus Saccharimonadales bacterium]|nr:neutral zinc metallopeptidase [Candidatus Saccharimonadales bacterium]
MADWDKILARGDVEDRRAAGPLLVGGGGLGVVGVVIALIMSFAGGNPQDLNNVLNQLQQSQGQPSTAQQSKFAGADSYETFAGAVLGSTNEVWNGIFSQSGKTYDEPKLVLFRSTTNSACGGATSQVGPHYCPADETIYLDETFFDELTNRLGAQGGDVAEAYVLAHEVGHHVQHELGTMDQVQGGEGANSDAVRLELQADCFAGIWAHSVAQLGIFEQGEIHEAIDAAEAVGDDRIQQKVQGQVNPESWTHGSSEQRASWFNRGFETGRPSDCNTF